MKKTRVSVINGVAKKAALGAMLASSVAVFASNPIKTARTENPPQTEVVSKDGADALKAMTFPQQQNPDVPTVHNKKLDEKLLKFADNNEEKEHITEYISNIYNTHGSYLGSAMLQQTLDVNMFYEFLDGNIEILKRFDEEAYNKIDRDAMQKVAEKSEPIKEWLNENYFAVYNQPFGQFNNPPNAEEVSNALDKYLNEDPYNLFGGETSIDRNYTLLNNICKRRLANTNYDNIQKGSNYVAYQVVNADYLLFFSLLKSFGIDIVSHIDNPHDKNLVKYLSVVRPNIGL